MAWSKTSFRSTFEIIMSSSCAWLPADTAKAVPPELPAMVSHQPASAWVCFFEDAFSSCGRRVSSSSMEASICSRERFMDANLGLWVV